MGWVLPRTISNGDVLTAGDANKVVGCFTTLQQFVALYAQAGALTGSAPAAGTAPNFLIQAGRAVVNPLAGAFSFTLPALFPNGILMCRVQPEGNSGAQDVISIDGGNTDGNTLAGIWWHGGSGYTASNQVVHFVAYGF